MYWYIGFLNDLVYDCRISLYLPISPYLSLYIPISPYPSLSLPIYLHRISLHRNNYNLKYMFNKLWYMMDFHCTVYIVHCTLYTIYNVHCTLYTINTKYVPCDVISSVGLLYLIICLF